MRRKPIGGATAYLDARFFPAHQDHWDDHLFARRVRQRIHSGSRVLDLGAGAGVVPQLNFRGGDWRIHGLDPDPRVLQNPHLDEGRVGVGEEIPYPEETFDLVISCNSVEHFQDVDRVLLEIRRVLKPHGTFLFKTPNVWHYVPLLARLTPTSFHKYYNSLRGRREVDTFPTCYRLNSERQVRKHARNTGFTIEEIELVEGRPEYLRLWWPGYLLGLAYERLVNATPYLASLRILMIVELRPGPRDPREQEDKTAA